MQNYVSQRSDTSTEGKSGSAHWRIEDIDFSAIHPEAIFVVHGFGHDLPCESRAFHKGISDSKCLNGGLDMQDMGGGGLAMQEHFVTLEKVTGSGAA